jgi:acetyl esterase/lipase
MEERYYLWEKGKVPYFEPAFGQNEPSLKPFLLNNGKKNGCVIVCPGGSYAMKAEHEGDPISRMINSHGVSAFTLDYRVQPYHYPAITEDVIRAVRYVRYHAEEFNIDPNKIAVMGFSAGGHLANSALCAFDYGRHDGDAIDRVSSRPDAVILCYAVISLGKYTHNGTKFYLLDCVENGNEVAEMLSGELQVKDDTPPCFIWHTAEDSVVPVQNSLQLYNALCEKHIYSELHVFPYGWHGLGLSEALPNPAQWTGLVGNWLDLMGFRK